MYENEGFTPHEWNPHFEGMILTTGPNCLPKGLSDEQVFRFFKDIYTSREDFDLITEALDFKDFDETYNPGTEVLVQENKPWMPALFEAIVIRKFQQTERTMRAFAKRTLNKYLKGSDIQFNAENGDIIVGKPRKKGSFAYVSVQIPLSDGQTVSVLFHSPDGDKLKILREDTIIAYQWILNKKDITNLVAPEDGREIDLESVGKRVARVVKENSASFQERKASADSEKAEIENLKVEVQGAITELDNVIREYETLEEPSLTVAAQLKNTLAMIAKVKAENGELRTQLDGLQKAEKANEESKLASKNNTSNQNMLYPGKIVDTEYFGDFKTVVRYIYREAIDDSGNVKGYFATNEPSNGTRPEKAYTGGVPVEFTRLTNGWNKDIGTRNGDEPPKLHPTLDQLKKYTHNGVPYEFWQVDEKTYMNSVAMHKREVDLKQNQLVVGNIVRTLRFKYNYGGQERAQVAELLKNGSIAGYGCIVNGKINCEEGIFIDSIYFDEHGDGYRRGHKPKVFANISDVVSYIKKERFPGIEPVSDDGDKPTNEQEERLVVGNTICTLAYPGSSSLRKKLLYVAELLRNGLVAGYCFKVDDNILCDDGELHVDVFYDETMYKYRDYKPKLFNSIDEVLAYAKSKFPRFKITLDNRKESTNNDNDGQSTDTKKNTDASPTLFDESEIKKYALNVEYGRYTLEQLREEKGEAFANATATQVRNDTIEVAKVIEKYIAKKQEKPDDKKRVEHYERLIKDKQYEFDILNSFLLKYGWETVMYNSPIKNDQKQPQLEPVKQDPPFVAILNSIISGEHDSKPNASDVIDKLLDQAADMAESAGLMDEYDALLNQAADHLTEVMDREDQGGY